MLKKILSIIAISMILSSANITAQTNSNQTALYTGFVKDETGVPINAEIRFVNLSNAPIITRANQDGSYTAVLRQNSNYYLMIKGYIEFGGLKTFEVPKYDKYHEETRHFIATKLVEGLELVKCSLFNDKDTTISQKGIEFLKVFKEFYSLNKNLQFKLFIPKNEVVFKDKSIKKTEIVNKKKKTTTIKIKSSELANEFLQARSRNLQAELTKAGLPLKLFKIEFDQPTKVEKPAKTKSKNKTKEKPNIGPNTRIVIDKIMKM